MFRKTMIASALLLGLAAPAYASQCPTLMTEIDAALQTAQISEDDKAKVMELRQKGEEEHEAGNHQASEDALNEAKALLGI